MCASSQPYEMDCTPTDRLYTPPSLQAWEAPAERRHRCLALYLMAQVVRALGRMGQHALLEEGALYCELSGRPQTAVATGAASGLSPRSSTGEQLGLLGVSLTPCDWLRGWARGLREARE